MRRSLTWLLAGGLGLAATPAWAVSESDIARYAVHSDRFDAQLPAPRLSRLSRREKQRRAACILRGMERQHGADGVEAALQLIQVLSSGVEFDDPTIESFNGRYGSVYGRLVRRCTETAGGA
ncbi:MAG: hypothetical protein AAGA32_09915 [Pseudomonadota bacterium]